MSKHGHSGVAFEDLAGTTLDDVSLDWRNGIALVSFLPSKDRSEVFTLRASGVRRVEIARKDGASREVAHVKKTGHDHCEIAMQSGELQRIEAAEITLTSVPV